MKKSSKYYLAKGLMEAYVGGLISWEIVRFTIRCMKVKETNNPNWGLNTK